MFKVCPLAVALAATPTSAVAWFAFTDAASMSVAFTELVPNKELFNQKEGIEY